MRMSSYRRWRQPGGTFFFTLVTHARRAVLTVPEVRAMLRQAFQGVSVKRPFETLGVALLPEHLHCIWRLPEGDEDYATRWRQIKGQVTRGYAAGEMAESPTTSARRRRGERGLWQRRYWEHWIRDELDRKRHMDYIHYNPVKHGLVARAGDWPFSSFRRYVALGEYESDWGEAEPTSLHDWQPGSFQ
jgi:putative transposase